MSGPHPAPLVEAWATAALNRALTAAEASSLRVALIRSAIRAVRLSDTEPDVCPSCGESQVVQCAEGGFSWVECDECHARGPRIPYDYDMDESDQCAVRAWNRLPRIHG